MVKKIIIPLLLVFSAFLIFSLYKTYAYDTSVVEETPSTTDLEYTFKIGNSSIKQITVDSGETKYYDIVLGNPNPAKISYSIYYEMVSPSTKPDGFSIEYTSKSTGESTGKVDKETNVTLNLVVTNTSDSSVTIKLGSLAGYVNGGELTLGSGQEIIPKKYANFVEKLDDGTTGDSGSGVYKVKHSAIASDNSATGKEIPAVTDYRYYGESPNNYICMDKTNNTCEDRHLYRIIGSIYEENAGQNLIKVVKATPLTDGNISKFMWEPDNNNDWDNSTIKRILNEDWYNSKQGGYKYNSGDDYQSYNFTNYGLSNEAKTKINEQSLYYLGSWNTEKVKTYEIYVYERSNNKSQGKQTYGNYTIGLLYPSDYGYASGNNCSENYTLLDYYSDCKSKNWLYINVSGMWFITPSSVSYKVYQLGGGGLYTLDYSYPDGNGIIRQTFYLSPDVKITGGTGEENNPYTISK